MKSRPYAISTSPGPASRLLDGAAATALRAASTPRGRWLRASVLAVLFASVAGCASYGPGGLKPGATVADISTKMGTPTGEYKMPDGTRRLEYARGPMGVHTYMLDLDAAGRLKSTQQVLTEERFLDIRPGMSEEDLLRTIGQPAEMRYISWQKLALWNYRYENSFCNFFQVELDVNHKVTSAGHGPDPLCTPYFE
ncbi:hypothetical protein BH09PSE5_BH09PSE5_06400 [soil metagenome]